MEVGKPKICTILMLASVGNVGALVGIFRFPDGFCCGLVSVGRLIVVVSSSDMVMSMTSGPDGPDRDGCGTGIDEMGTVIRRGCGSFLRDNMSELEDESDSKSSSFDEG